ncbi:MAG: ThuA domain-containing protein [Pirellulaceae bacterium]
MGIANMHRTVFVFATILLGTFLQASEVRGGEEEKLLRVLLITGGCCHDYDFQTKQLIQASMDEGHKMEWTVINEGGKGTRAKIDLYNNPNWADGYDVVVHNECFADTADPDYIRKITKAHHDGVSAVVIHCAMHTYRSAKIDDWREFLGVTSRRHDHQSKYPVKVVAADHPIMNGFPANYVTPMDELYIIEHVWPETKVLATSTSEKDGKSHPVMWTNQYGKARVFGTTYGHSNDTFSDKVFLRTVIQGIVWAAEKDANE